MIRPELALAVALAATACAEDDGPLDRSTLAALARERGDAFGGANAGTWLVTLDRVECTCDEEAAALACIANPPAAWTLVEGDGVVTVVLTFADIMSGSSVQFTGPIDADGSFSAALVTSVAALQGELRLLARIDAVTDLTPPAGELPTMTGRMRVRMAGGLDQVTIDCGSDFDVEAVRLF